MSVQGKNKIFVIQKHDASHLHYDFRIEEGGVLKSWAIPKEPPQEPGIKRLAIQVEDHPVGYEKFEGEIPEGEYGAGKVETWDTGYYLPVEMKPGKIIIELNGRKLNGIYCLIRLASRNSEKKNWLFFKKT